MNNKVKNNNNANETFAANHVEYLSPSTFEFILMREKLKEAEEKQYKQSSECYLKQQQQREKYYYKKLSAYKDENFYYIYIDKEFVNPTITVNCITATHQVLGRLVLVMIDQRLKMLVLKGIDKIDLKQVWFIEAVDDLESK